MACHVRPLGDRRGRGQAQDALGRDGEAADPARYLRAVRGGGHPTDVRARVMTLCERINN